MISSFVADQSLNRVQLTVTSWTAICQAPLSSTVSGVCSDSCPLRWCYPIISSSAAPFIFCLQSFPALGFFPMNQLITTGGQSIGASPSASVLPVSIQGWFPLGLIGFDLLLSKAIGTSWSTVTVILIIVHKLPWAFLISQIRHAQ